MNYASRCQHCGLLKVDGVNTVDYGFLCYKCVDLIDEEEAANQIKEYERKTTRGNP